MEMENDDFYVKELNGIRIIAYGLIRNEDGNVPRSKNLFQREMDAVVLRFQREIQDRQLHLYPASAIFMDHLQMELSRISDDCNNSLSSKKHGTASLDLKAYLEIIIAVINDLLEYLKTEFGSCFNFQMKVPYRLKQKMNLVLVREWNRIMVKLKEVGIQEELVFVLSGFYDEMQANKTITFKELDFWQTFNSSIRRIDFKQNSDVKYCLFSELCYINFNYHPLIQFCTKTIQRDYDQVDNYREEFIKITIHLRTLKQFVVRPDYGYDQGIATLRDILYDIMDNELLCVKKLISMNKKVLAGNGAKFFLQQFYFRISISMEVFLFIFRLMIEKGIVLVNRKADLFEFIHSHIGTTKKDNLSIGNMQNTYAENNRQTAVRAKVLLQTLISQIDEKYLSVCFIISLF